MPITREELDSFHAFAIEKISNESADLSWWEMLEMWRTENPTDEEVAAVKELYRQGVEDIEAGRGISADEFHAQLNREFGPVDA